MNMEDSLAGAYARSTMVSVAPREHQKRRIWQFAAVDKSSGTGPSPSASRRSQHAWKGAECDDSADDQSPDSSPAFHRGGHDAGYTISGRGDEVSPLRGAQGSPEEKELGALITAEKAEKKKDVGMDEQASPGCLTFGYVASAA